MRFKVSGVKKKLETLKTQAEALASAVALADEELMSAQAASDVAAAERKKVLMMLAEFHFHFFLNLFTIICPAIKRGEKGYMRFAVEFLFLFLVKPEERERERLKE